MTPGPGATKSDWRRHFREQVRQLTPAERVAASALICRRLESRPEWQRARAVFLFVPLHEPGRADLPVGLEAQQRVPTRFMVPMRDSGIVEATLGEPDILPLAQAALAAGKIVAFPRHCPNEDSYEAARVTDLAQDLTPGRFGIPEPRAECPRFPLNELDFSLVPGIGYALDGGRLGRGRGYFDRLLAAIPSFKCGVAFDCQVAPEFSLEPHDVRLDCILTPTRWHPTASRART